ncbi:c-type cytochrome [Brucella sp. BE17]|uniref:c-type cytochrome n=1 Tax=Brucella sp. BE17 TaxID=3142977 RepID=UPI0031B9E669
MNSTRTNKFIMAFLATVFVAMTISILSDSLFHAPAPEKPGYTIEVADAPAGGAAGAPAKEEVSIATLLQSADPARGQNVFKRCAACHTAEKGGANKVGPHLWDIVNRPAASVDGFGYSAAMKEFGAAGNNWDFEHLNKFLTSPKGFIRGTAMGFAGDKKDNERADLIAYLHTLSDNPAPLPSADAAPAEGENAAPAEGESKPAEEGQAPASEDKPAESSPEGQEGQQPAGQAPAPETPEQAPAD